MVREAAVAGQFYPGNRNALRAMLRELTPEGIVARPAVGLMAPHAGYVYSGEIAARTFAQVRIPPRVVILGPNHRGIGHPAAVYPEGAWETPLGATPIDERLAERILSSSPRMAADAAAHRYEHSLEVQLPFIQTLAPEASIVPICLGSGKIDDLLAMGEGLGTALAGYPQEVLLVASTDMTHYESGEAAREKDGLALAKILDLDPAGLFRVVRGERISMCGVVPVVVMLAAALRLGATSATLVRYGNSGDVTGDPSQVVGYAGVVVR